MSIKEQVQTVRESLKNHEDVRVVAAVKYFDIEKTKEIYEAGIKDIGETRLTQLFESLSNWNFQFSKIEYLLIAPMVHLSLFTFLPLHCCASLIPSLFTIHISVPLSSSPKASNVAL